MSWGDNKALEKDSKKIFHLDLRYPLDTISISVPLKIRYISFSTLLNTEGDDCCYTYAHQYQQVSGSISIDGGPVILNKIHESWELRVWEYFYVEYDNAMKYCVYNCNKRRRPASDTLHISDLPIGFIVDVSAYLAKPSRAILAIAFHLPSSIMLTPVSRHFDLKSTDWRPSLQPLYQQHNGIY